MMRFFGWTPSQLEEVTSDSELAWLLKDAMRVLKARERIERQQDIQAALHAQYSVKFRQALGDIAYDEDSDEYRAYISGLAGEQHVTIE